MTVGGLISAEEPRPSSVWHPILGPWLDQFVSFRFHYKDMYRVDKF